MKRISLILLILFLCYSYDIGQNAEWVYFSGGTNVKSFAEEENYIWIASNTGVVKMDKTTGNKIYYNKTTCPIIDNYVNKIIIDNNGNFWLSTNRGLLKYDRNNWELYNKSNSLIPSDYIKYFAIDTSNNIWLSDEYYGLIKFDGINWVNYQYPTLNKYNGSGEIEIGIDGSIWQKTLFDLVHFDGKTWAKINAENSPIPNRKNLTSLSVDQYGNKWIGTHVGFLVYRDNGVKYISDPS